MQKDKYILADFHRGYLRKMRKQRKLAAEDISVLLGFSKAWLGKLERGQLQSIRKYDLARILSVYIPDTTPEDIISQGRLDNFLESGLPIANRDEFLCTLENLDIPEKFFRCITQATTDSEKCTILHGIYNLLYCFEDYPNIMNILLAHSELFFETIVKYSTLSPDQFLSKINTFTAKITSIIQEEHKKAMEL